MPAKLPTSGNAKSFSYTQTPLMVSHGGSHIPFARSHVELALGVRMFATFMGKDLPTQTRLPTLSSSFSLLAMLVSRLLPALESLRVVVDKKGGWERAGGGG